MLSIAMSLLLLAGVSSSPAATWYEHYAEGVHLIEQGKAAEARPHLDAALAARSEEGLQVPAGRQQYVDYLPHLYLAISNHMAGDVARARRELQLAETSGVAAKSEIGRSLLVAYELLLRGDGESASGQPLYAVYQSKPPVLTEQEFKLLRDDVLSKCDLPTDANMAQAPWYANYELGLELERKGDHPRALRHFIFAVAKRPNPERHARMYGMWLVDYYPYFHIARAHVRLENWDCAKNALDISSRLREIPADVPEMQEALSLRRESERRLAAKP
jgi:hypothetical protein